MSPMKLTLFVLGTMNALLCGFFLGAWLGGEATGMASLISGMAGLLCFWAQGHAD